MVSIRNTYFNQEDKQCRYKANSGVPRGGLGGGSNTPPPPEIPNALQNRAKLNQIVKTVKNY